MGNQVFMAENVIDTDNFLSVDDQDGEYVNQPVAVTSNIGELRFNTTGDISDFTYDGTTSSNGAVGGTTVIDDALEIYGDDYFIGGTVKITSGAASGETKTITDFAQATGTITTAAFSAQIVSGVTYTLTLTFSDREYKVALDFGGNLGAATFKWSHDGGTTYFGRNDPNQANWLGQTLITTGASGGGKVIDLSGNDLIVIYQRTSDSYPTARTSADNGISWGAEISIYASNFSFLRDAVRVSSGRILTLWANYTGIIYSDNDGLNWSIISSVIGLHSIIELTANVLYGVTQNGSSEIDGYISTDNGVSWSDAIGITTGVANSQDNPYLRLNEDGDIVCVYQTDEDSVGDYEIKCKISTDGGYTWGSTIDILDFGANDIANPKLEMDINGDLYCTAIEEDGTPPVLYSLSINGGSSWGAQTTLLDTGSSTIWPFLTLIGGHRLICTYMHSGGSSLSYVSRGMWEAYSSNSCTVPINLIPQHIIHGVYIKWIGSSGYDEDNWTFDIGYQYAATNILKASPSIPWRTAVDNAEITIVFDMTAANTYSKITALALFGINYRLGDIQGNATDSWGAPSVDQSFDTAIASGVVDAINGNIIQDTSLLANYVENELAGKYFVPDAGADDGTLFKIITNDADSMIIDGTPNIVATNAFSICDNKLLVVLSSLINYRYIRLVISAQHTVDDYYQTGTVIIGPHVNLTEKWSLGYNKNTLLNVSRQTSPSGGVFSIAKSDPKYQFKLTWNGSETSREELNYLLRYCQGNHVVISPDDGGVANVNDCYLVTPISDTLTNTQIFSDRFNYGSIIFEEIT